MKVKAINHYVKDKKHYVVVKLEDGNTFFMPYGLLKYAMENPSTKKGE